jgi:outer membrane lipoprotein-sorting protein
MAYAQLSVAEVLQRVKAVYAGAQRFQFVSRIAERRQGSETTGSDEIVVDRDRLWFKAEGSLAVAESGGAEGTTLIVVADGRSVWIYLQGRQEYTRVDGIPAARNSEGTDENYVDNPKALARTLMDSKFVRYAQFQRMSERAKILREEPCIFNSARSECYVVEINGESLTPTVTGTYTLWVDKRRYLVLRDDYRVVDTGVVGYENSILLVTAKVNSSLPSGRFSFVPPQGAKQVDSFF